MNKKSKNYTVTFATYNCLEYTKKCINSLINSGVDTRQIVVVDNSSSDGTVEYLKNLDLGGVILNTQNLSCGVAWNQGILARQSEWTIIMNNDIVVNKGFADRLIDFAVINELQLVSPARIDGLANYDVENFSDRAQCVTSSGVRWGSSNAICMCIHWSLFQKIGFFRADPNLLGFEDGLFFNEVRRKKIRHATTGSVWIHHFGGITQEYIKKIKGLQIKDLLVKVNDRKLYGQSWIQRKYYRYQLVKSHVAWRNNELLEFGMTLHGVRNANEFVWF